MLLTNGLPEGRVKLDLMYKPGRSNPIGIGLIVTYAENTEFRIQNAIHKKSKQIKILNALLFLQFGDLLPGRIMIILFKPFRAYLKNQISFSKSKKAAIKTS